MLYGNELLAACVAAGVDLFRSLRRADLDAAEDRTSTRRRKAERVAHRVLLRL
jgi:hypothetical protein